MCWVKYRVKRTYQNTDISTEYFDLLFGHSYSILFRYPSPASGVDDVSHAQDIEHVPDIITVLLKGKLDMEQLFLPVNLLL